MLGMPKTPLVSRRAFLRTEDELPQRMGRPWTPALCGGAVAMTQPIRSQIAPLQQVETTVIRWRGAVSHPASDELVAEEPLEIRVRSVGSVGGSGTGVASTETLAGILRTPGHDDELAAGFLLSEGLLRGRDELATLALGTDPDNLPSDNVLDVLSAPGVDLLQRVNEEGYSRRFAVNSSCGVCGKNSVTAACAALPPIPFDDFVVPPEVLYSLPDRLHAEQRVFAHTGGLHAAGLFDGEGTLLALREDIGRHNAVDKLLGRA